MWGKKLEQTTKTPEKAISTLKWMCSRQERTRKTCFESLKRWNVDEKLHSGIIKELEDEKFLDELRYTTMYINDKVNFNKWGKSKIITNLKLKGIDNDTIEQGFSNSDFDPATSLESLIELLIKKEPKVNAQNNYQKRQKLAQWAYTRGYSFDHINTALDQVLKNED